MQINSMVTVLIGSIRRMWQDHVPAAGRGTIRKFLCNAWVAMFGTVAGVAPDLLVNLFEHLTVWTPSRRYIAFLWLVCFILVSTKHTKLILFLIGSLCILEIIQICHLAYFGVAINSGAIGWMFSETADVAEAVVSEAGRLWYVPLVVLLPYGFFFFAVIKTSGKRLILPGAVMPVIFVLLLPIYQEHEAVGKVNLALADPNRDTLRNILFATEKYLTRLTSVSEASMRPLPDYKPYNISMHPLDHKKITIIVVMGESFSYNRMGLFGYYRDTTPKLDSLRGENTFVAKKSLSSGTSTQVSVPFFFNLQRDPRNVRELRSNRTNLFRLAKENGFSTTYISAQDLMNFSDVSIKYIDEIHTRSEHPELFRKYRDDMLLMILRTIKLTSRNFIVLHQRSAHETYELNYAHRGDEIKKYATDKSLSYRERKGNAYDNAIRYNDDVLYNIIQYAKRNIEGPVYLFITADHGENLGENGLWGHGFLVPNTARIPFIAVVERGSEKFLHRLKQLRFPTHFEIATLVADRLGYQVSDPNTEEGVYYIGGLHFLEGHGMFITVVKHGNEVAFERWPKHVGQ